MGRNPEQTPRHVPRRSPSLANCRGLRGLLLCVSKRTQSIARYLRLSFLTLQRGNAVGNAPRHRFAPRRSSQDRTRSVAR
ncbi:hypothetical protein CCL22_08140 [Pseudomonas syringae]|nr:hypothetical protein CCL22_08140 [Pseudomonas syringae]